MIYVSTDGSFVQNPERCGFGVNVEDDDGKPIYDLSGYTIAEEYLKSWNISSELIAAIIGVVWAASNGFTEITLYYDYTGVEHFMTGYFKAKSDIAKKYVAILSGLKRTFGIDITFVKVKGHSGHKGNERADKLAGRYEDDRTVWLEKLLTTLLVVFVPKK